MRTVGPLPPAVYWRRRAVVAGGVVGGVVLMLYSCAGGGAGGSAGSSAANRVSLSPSVTAPATPTKPTSTANPFLPHASATASVAATAAVRPTVSATATGPPPVCTDADITLTARAETATSATGSYLKLILAVKNSSTRPCTRDLGSDPQEMRVMQGARRIWSSDDCGGTHLHDVRTLPPGDELTFYTFWNGRTSAPGCPAGQAAAPAGTYAAVARLGTDLSAPAPFTRTG